MRDNQATVELAVAGMTCGSCERHVAEALREVAGVTEVRVSLRDGRATVEYDAGVATVERMVEAVEGAGYRAGEATNHAPAGPPAGRCGTSCCA